MDIELPENNDKSIKLRTYDIYGAYSQEGRNTFDHREELEPIGQYLPGCSIDTISLWFDKRDLQNVALQGIQVTYRKVSSDSYIETYQQVPDKLRNIDREWDVINFEYCEYIQAINVRIADANLKVGGLTFITTKNQRTAASCGDTECQEDDKGNTTKINLPPGSDKSFNFTKPQEPNLEGGYIVGFYGQYDKDYITHLGVYVATFSQIHYFCRRPYILLYYQLKDKPEVLKKVEKLLNIQRDADKKITDAKIIDPSNKILFYLVDSSVRYRDLFRAVLEYLY